jgi:hypothetical protein
MNPRQYELGLAARVTHAWIEGDSLMIRYTLDDCPREVDCVLCSVGEIADSGDTITRELMALMLAQVRELIGE